MVRLVKGAYWDSEIKRAQVDGLDGYPVYTRKVHTDVAYLACARSAARRARRDLSAVRDPQRAHARRGPRAGRRRRGRADRYEFQCLHGMGEPLYEQVVGSVERAGSIGRAASTRRSARTRRCSPTSCGGCSRTAPTRRSSIASSIRSVPIDALIADPVRRSSGSPREAGDAAARRIRDPAAARALTARRGAIRAASISPTKTRWQRSRTR